MNIEFVGRRVRLDERVREHAAERIGRLAKLLGEPVEVHVILENQRFRKIVEVRVRLRRTELLAREEAPDMVEALNVAVEKIEGQARRLRERRVNRKRRIARAAAPKAIRAGRAARSAES